MQWLPVTALAVGIPGAAYASPAADAPAQPHPAALAQAPCPPLRAPAPHGVRPFRYPPTGDVQAREVYQPEGALSWSIEGAPEVTALSRTIASVLAFNAVRYGHGTATVFGFLPGELYQEVYARDLLTSMKAAQYLYGEAFLRSGVERFLDLQHTTVSPRAEFSRAPYPGPGALPGLLHRDGSGDKTTAVSDEESSIIQLAHIYASVQGGAEWLQCQVAGRPVIERLNRAAEAILQGRLHPATGLIKRSHTTDWGDVRMQGGAAPTEAQPFGETWTASIYDQAWMYRALLDLADMNRAAGLETQAQRFAEHAQRLRKATNELLWMPDRGYYRLHLHLTPLQHDFDEDAMVAIGNAVAVYAGLTEPYQERSIFAALERARLQAGSLKPGLSVYPPYHEGFFRHHLQYESGRYQNGGQWDWWGGVQVTAEFMAGYSGLAWQHLEAIARDWATHPNDIAEWQVPATNRMEGSRHYAGAAGTVAEAVVRGAFGVDLHAEGFALRPRLGERNAYLHLMQPAAQRSLWYRQRLVGSTLVTQYQVEHNKPGSMTLLLPAGATAVAATLDNAPLPFAMTAVGDDRYVDLGEVPPGAHTVRVTLAPDEIRPAVRLTFHGALGGAPADGTVAVPLRVQSTAGGPVVLSYQWLPADAADAAPALEGVATLPRPLAPGEEAAQTATVPVPAQPGRYRLRLAPALAEGAPAAPAALETEVTVSATAVAAAVHPWAQPGLARAGQPADLGFVLRNTGYTAWQRPRVTARWLTADGRALTGVDPAEVSLPAVPPGAPVYAAVTLRAPAVPGDYHVALQAWDGGRALPLSSPTTFSVSVTP